MKTLTVKKGNEMRRFALDVVRSQHIITFDAALTPGQEAPPYHIPNHKFLLVIELRPIRALDDIGTGRVIDRCEQFEWVFDTHQEAGEAVTVEEV